MRIIHRSSGQQHGPVVRLMSPGDLGQVLKPFVFLDLFHGDANLGSAFGLHPHSGIATVTVLTEGNLRFAGPAEGCGIMDYGAVEWMRAGNGIWHGNEMSPGSSERVQGFQLWIALPPELENTPAQAQYLESRLIPQVGPARLILGQYLDAHSPVQSPAGINYFVVSLEDGQAWDYVLPAGHLVAWVGVSKGTLLTESPIRAGEIAVFAPGVETLSLRAKGQSRFVLGSAVPHDYPLVLGNYSVHSSGTALRSGETHIAELRRAMQDRIPKSR